MAKKTFINNNTFSGYLHFRVVVQHSHLGLQDDTHLFQPSRWCDMALPSWALTFPMLGSLQYPKPFLTPSLQALMALASHWHHTLTWACVDNRLIGPWHFLFVLQLRACLDRLFINVRFKNERFKNVRFENIILKTTDKCLVKMWKYAFSIFKTILSVWISCFECKFQKMA